MECLIIDSTELMDKVLYAQALSLVSEERSNKINRYLFEKDRLLSTVAGLYIRYVECRYRTEIHYGQYDKPLTSDDNVHFNISHSGCYVVFVSSDTPVGIDIEEKGDYGDIHKVVMTADEQSVFSDIPDTERKDVFYRLWTAKESYMKVLGTGLTLKPSSFEVLSRSGIVSPDDRFRMHELIAPPGYSVTVCSDKQTCPELKTISCRELIQKIQFFQCS